MCVKSKGELMLKKCNISHNKCWGLLIAAFGTFFLVANLIPSHAMMRYWPVFLIAAGIMKMHCGSCSKGDKN
jgi:hypothetical protein